MGDLDIPSLAELAADPDRLETPVTEKSAEVVPNEAVQP